MGLPPTEDLMREHGVLDRVLLVYEELAYRLESRDPSSPIGTISRIAFDAATIVKVFVEDYHEQLEEKFVFPELKKHGEHAYLVDTLDQQHHVGQKITRRILAFTRRGSLNRDERNDLASLLRMFSTMYRPHSAREDTVVFPAWRSLHDEHELHELGEQFERIEEERFGEGGFERFVGQIALMENALGIHDLRKFTPGV